MYWALVLLIVGPTVAAIINRIIHIAKEIKAKREYEKSTYFKDLKIPYKTLIKDIGSYGEYLTYSELKGFEEKGAKFLFNIYIPKDNGDTTEIDLLMISTKGIFAFESKNYSGWIFGDEENNNWYQTLPIGRRSRKETFYNPIKQNKSHISHLKEFLGKDIKTKSFIVFSNRCTLKNVKVKNKDVVVVYRKNVGFFVSYNCKDAEDVLSYAEIEEIYRKLYPYTQVSSDIKNAHITNINKNLKSEQCVVSKTVFEKTIGAEGSFNNYSKPLCPRCGGNLVLRTATKGDRKGQQFYGCSNFPKCRYTKNLY